MQITNIEIRWQDEWQDGAVTIPGVIWGDQITITGVTGNPQVHNTETSSWINLTVSGSFYTFSFSPANGTHEVKFRDDAFPSVETKLMDLTIEDQFSKGGSPTSVDVIYRVTMTIADLTFQVSYPNLYYLATYLIYNAVEELMILPLVKQWSDFTYPATLNIRSANGWTGNVHTSPAFIVYELVPSPSCDLVLTTPTIVQPDRNLSNGSFTINATSTGIISYKIDEGSWQANNIYTGLSGGTYTAYVKDDTGNCGEFSQTIVLSEKYLRVAHLNAIEFKLPDNARQNFDNTLFVDRLRPYSLSKPFYCQKYFNDDIVKVQFQSSYSGHDIKVLNYKTKAVLGSLTETLVFTSPQGFKYYDFSVDFSAYSGIVQITIKPTGYTAKYISEPVEILTEDLENEYVKIEWGNDANGSDMYWMSAIQPFLYVNGEISETDPRTSKEVFRDGKWNLKTISRELSRTVLFDIHEQPHYILEKIQWATGQSIFLVDDIAYNAEEGLQERNQGEKYSLGKAQLAMEQMNVFTGELSSTPSPDVYVDYLQVNEIEEGLQINPDDVAQV